MKKIITLTILFITVVVLSGCGCNKIDFSYFSNKVSNVNGYRHYVISQEIYNNELLLYKEDKTIYAEDDTYRIEIKTKEIEDIDSENLYKESEEAYFQDQTYFYYNEEGIWKVKEVEDSVGTISFSIKKKMFENYKIKEKDGSKFFEGKIKDSSLTEFLGFEIEGVSNMILNIEINNKNKVKEVSLEYQASNGNKVIVRMEVGYKQVIHFELPKVA